MNREEDNAQPSIQALREVLASLYSSASASRRVTDDAAVPQAHILFEAPAVDRWYQILKEAERHGRLGAIAQIASKDYPTEPRLRQALESLDLLVGDPLEALYQERDSLIAKGSSTNEVNERIIELKRKLRHGPELLPDEYLADRYRLIKVIGGGGFGTVWKAYDRTRSQWVAIKVLHGQYTRDKSFIERFQRGARAMARLRHQNVVKIEGDYAKDNGFHYFVMELVEGENLASAVLNGRLDAALVLPLIRQIGDVLHHAHSNGVIHRDVTPANVLLRADGRPLLTDFDLALVADSTAGTRGAMGTVPYAAPETWMDASAANERADIFSLGMIMIFALTRQQLTLGHFTRRYLLIRDLPCSDAVKVAIARAVEEEPAQRHPSVQAFCESLVTPPSRELLQSYLGTETEVRGAGLAVTVGSRGGIRKPRRKAKRETGAKRSQQQRYKIPEMTRKALLRALEEFDQESRGQKRWQNFVNHPRHKYGILHEGRLYPVKEMIERATGLETGKFSGGSYANAPVAELGFKIVRLRESDSVDRDAVAGRLFREGDNHEEFDALSADQRERILSWIRQTYTRANTLHQSTSARLKLSFESTHDFRITNGVFKGAMAAAGFEPIDDLQRNWRFWIRLASKATNKKLRSTKPSR